MEAWYWKGPYEFADTSLDLSVKYVGALLNHRIVFMDSALSSLQLGLWITSEQIEEDGQIIYQSDLAKNTIRMASRNSAPVDTPFHEKHRHDQSGLAQFRSHTDYPSITRLAFMYEQVRIYDAWAFGRETVFRSSQPTDLRGDRLEEDYSNLGIYLNRMGATPDAKSSIIEGMTDLYDRFIDYEVVINAGTTQLFFTERIKGKRQAIPAQRLSDGTLRYLCLLSILYNPTPPPVVCIEEPELGLHPDIVVRLAKHLQAASENMQLIVTTHSDILVDAFSDVPESIVVFDNDNGSTQMNRLDRDEMSAWLDDYRLGQLWTSGQIGGTRW